MLVLDTDHVSLLQWGAGDQAQRLHSRLQAVDEEVAVTIVSYEEQTRGWLAYVARARTLGQQVEAYRRLRRHLDIYRTAKVLDFDEQAATQFQRLKHARHTERVLPLGFPSLTAQAVHASEEECIAQPRLVGRAICTAARAVTPRQGKRDNQTRLAWIVEAVQSSDEPAICRANCW
jgi:tRNA(fMet)-specific endonuclease VapC